MSDDPTPVTMFEGDATARRWASRVEPAAVIIRCGRGKGGCDRLAQIFETPDGAVVVFYQHAAARPVTITPPEGGFPADYEPSSSFKRFDPEGKRGLLAGRRDETGTAVSLEDDNHWSNIVEPSCRTHLGTLDFSRAWLMDCLRRARADRSGRLRVSVPE